MVDYEIVQNSLLRVIDFFKVYDLMGHLSDNCLISLGLTHNLKATANCNSKVYLRNKETQQTLRVIVSIQYDVLISSANDIYR